MPAKPQHEFDQMAQIAKSEISRDAPKYAGTLDLSAGKEPVSTNEAAQIVAKNWSDPQFRHDLLDQETPERVIQLLLLAQGTVDQDTGKPMTVAAYKSKVLQPFMDTGTSPYLNASPADAIAPTHAPVPVHPILGADGTPLPADPSAAAAAPSAPLPTTPETPENGPPSPQTVPPASAPLDQPPDQNGALPQ